MYQVWITSITIHRFINHRQRLTQQRNLTCQNVLKILEYVISVMIVKDLGTGIAWAMCANSLCNMNVLYFYFFGTNILCQIFLFIGIALQCSMESISTTSPVESVLVTHAKVIGASKIVLFIIAGISHVAGIQNILAIIHFCFVEMFLVLVVIEITEILANPNALQQSNNVNGPGESV
ncbi:hypothetical protein CAEBREN_22798 [Caenorhabditis brenneri]|uniref:Uncharacterized protein n=1 Tax=Caenorhabditis brenneri TaxID=135651 RepID=G0M9X2_CAEBE|nr:hypothetical protein CAEBREN_22798 [Caenorhabditis brenneri]